MTTPFSSTTSYLSAAEFLLRRDSRPVGRLCSDSDTPVTAAALLTDPKLAAALLGGSGEVEAAAIVGKRYTPAILAALTGASQARFFDLIADATEYRLWKRRMNPSDSPSVDVEELNRKLEALRKGETIFGVLENAEAGMVSYHVEDAADVEERNMRTYQARRYFGRRSDRRDPV